MVTSTEVIASTPKSGSSKIGVCVLISDETGPCHHADPRGCVKPRTPAIHADGVAYPVPLAFTDQNTQHKDPNFRRLRRPRKPRTPAIILTPTTNTWACRGSLPGTWNTFPPSPSYSHSWRLFSASFRRSSPHLCGLPTGHRVHSPSEFKDRDLLFLDVEGEPVGAKAQKGLNRIVNLLGVFFANESAEGAGSCCAQTFDAPHSSAMRTGNWGWAK